MRLDKRLTAVTGLGIDGIKLMDLDRDGINWRLDPRLRADQQSREWVFARNNNDRGHLVRRASAVWGGTRAEAAQANVDTFYCTNAAPQAAKTNQGLELWLGMESYRLSTQRTTVGGSWSSPDRSSATSTRCAGAWTFRCVTSRSPSYPRGRTRGHRVRRGPDPAAGRRAGTAAARGP